jgi:hypothetical protein
LQSEPISVANDPAIEKPFMSGAFPNAPIAGMHARKKRGARIVSGRLED